MGIVAWKDYSDMIPAARGSGAVVPGSEAQQCLQQLNPVHSGQQDGHHVQLRQPRGRQRLQQEQERVSGETTEGAVQREAESGLRGLHRVSIRTLTLTPTNF